jgi:hypothetical protein
VLGLRVRRGVYVLHFVFVFFKTILPNASVALIWILQFCQKERPGIEPEGPDPSTINYTKTLAS